MIVHYIQKQKKRVYTQFEFQTKDLLEIGKHFHQKSIMSFTTLPIQTFEEFDPSVPVVLPHEKVYSIQVGYRLFRLSGLSLSSDSPSYFTKFFSEPENEEKVLFFDRSPRVFEKIYTHLQGYSINVEEDFEFMHLWSDACYFGLTGLRKVLTEHDYFATVGTERFKIPKALLQGQGNYPNYFSIHSERLYFDNLALVEKKNMLRPPPQRPCIVSNRSPELFRDLLEILRGNNLVIKSNEHRQLLIKEAKYYRFMELEQRMLQHKVLAAGIVLNLNDIARKGLVNDSPADKLSEIPMRYSRPYIDEPKRDLIFQIDNSLENQGDVKLKLNKKTKIVTAVFTKKTLAKYLKAFGQLKEGVMMEKESATLFVGFNNLSTVINGREMKQCWVSDLIGDNIPFTNGTDEPEGKEAPSKKRKLSDDIKGEIIELYLRKSLWKVMMRGPLARLEAVTLDAVTTLKEDKVEFL